MSWHNLALAEESCRGHGTFSPLLTFNSMYNVIYLYLAMSLGNWFCMSRKGGTGGGGFVYPENENSMAMYGLAVKIPQYRAISLILSAMVTYKTVILPCRADFICPSNLQ